MAAIITKWRQGDTIYVIDVLILSILKKILLILSQLPSVLKLHQH